MDLIPVLAGIAWDPEIRGILSVLVGVVVLVGSVYLLLSTNMGARLGVLVSLAALFGWLAIHSMFFWLFPPGQGPAGRIPGWDIGEINHADLGMSSLPAAHDIDTSGLPQPEELSDMTPEQIEQLSEEQADALNGWELLPEADPTRGEAQTAVDDALAEGIVRGLAAPEDYVYLYAFERGGKPEREGDGLWDRISNKVEQTLHITHPPHHAIVQLQPAIEQEEVPGQAPPTPEPDPNAEVISVILERDIGQRRVPAAASTIGSGAMFGLLCVMLHKRDQRVAEHRSAPVPATTET